MGQSMSERFWAKVDRSYLGPADCWPWTGYRNAAGYGMFAVEPRHGHHRPEGAHRVAFVLAGGALGAGDLVRHRCDNPPCCNPAHLLPGSGRDNARDMHQRGRAAVRRGEEAHSKLAATQVVEIRARLGAGASMRGLAREYGVSQALIYNIRERRAWAHL